jgi:ATP-dependent RNA helicase DHX29
LRCPISPLKSNLIATDTPYDSPLPSGATTPRLLEIDPRLGSKLKNGSINPRSPGTASPKKPIVAYHEDIEPEDLVPAYVDTQTKLFEFQRPRQDLPKGKGAKARPVNTDDPEEARLLAKLDKIEKDILFDNFVAEQQWRAKKITLEKEYSIAKRKRAEEERSKSEPENIPPTLNESDDINDEAARIAAEVLAENDSDDDDDQALADLFSSLPVSEVDPLTGKTNTVMNHSDGTKVVIRDFGKWSGVSPSRTLEEACRARSVTRTKLSCRGLICFAGTPPSGYLTGWYQTWHSRIDMS